MTPVDRLTYAITAPFVGAWNALLNLWRNR